MIGVIKLKQNIMNGGNGAKRINRKPYLLLATPKTIQRKIMFRLGTKDKLRQGQIFRRKINYLFSIISSKGISLVLYRIPFRFYLFFVAPTKID